MTDRSELMTIGAFAKRSRLSLKALRLYDEMGLLEPSHVDPHSGYRYYEESQLESARLVGLLRRLDMPLAQITDVVSLEPSAAVKSIAAYWHGVEADMQTKRRLVRYLAAYLSGKGEQMFKIETRQVQEQHVATIQRRVFVADLERFIKESMGRLHTDLAATGAETGIPFVVFHGEVNTDSDGPVEVCVPYTGSVKPAGEIRLRVEAAHEEAFTRITKRQVEFPGILEAYAAVEEWATEHDREGTGPPREVYFAEWDALGDDDPACDVAFPIA